METLREIVESNLDVRVWCFRCARCDLRDAMVLLSLFERRGWPSGLQDVAGRLRCSKCRLKDQTLLLPARRPGQEPFKDAPPGQAMSLLVEAFFHGMRSQRKRR